MGRFFLRRAGFLGLTFLLPSIIIFFVTHYLPGDIARIILGREASETQIALLRAELGLNEPLPIQYLRWLTDFVVGDWGTSYSTNSEIQSLVLQRLKNSLMLAAVSIFFAVPVSIFLGALAGLNRNRPVDAVISISTLSVVGLPDFVTGLVLIQVLAFRLELFPANSSIRAGMTFLEALPMLVLPALTAAFVLAAYIARLTRAGVIEELQRDYVRTAVLKGLSGGRIVFRHVLRNALMPTITVIAISLGWLIGGLIVIENVFNYPGLGRLMIFAIDRRDLPLMQAITMVTVLVFALANLAADLIYAYFDPKIRYR